MPGYTKYRSNWIDNVGHQVVAAFLNWIETAVFDLKTVSLNVKDYGAVGDGATDDYAAVVAAYADLPASGGTLFFPRGTYRFNTQLVFSSTKPVKFRGAGRNVSLLYPIPTVSTGDAIVFSGGASQFTKIKDLTIRSDYARDADSYLVSVTNGGDFEIDSVDVINFQVGGGLKLKGISNLRMRGLGGRVNSKGSFLYLDGVGGSITGCSGLVAPIAAIANSRPCVYMRNLNSLIQSHCEWGGFGPRGAWSIQSITSTGANFTVTTTANHDFKADQIFVIRNATVPTYNNSWRIASVTATTITVTSPLNPGASGAAGTAEWVAACVFMTTETGPVNETTLGDCTFADIGTPATYGKTDVYMDAAHDGGVGYAMTGNILADNYYDGGERGIYVESSTYAPSNVGTISGLTILGGQHNNKHCQLEISGAASGIDYKVGPSATVGSADGVGPTCAVRIYRGTEAQAPLSIRLDGLLGSCRSPGSATPPFTGYSYGVIVDDAGQATPPNDLSIVGDLYGTTKAILFTGGGSTLDGRRYAGIRPSSVNEGTTPPNNTNYIPSVASAPTIDLSVYAHGTVKITGTSSIQTITGGWRGREVRLLFASANALVAGGNIGTTRAVAAGELLTLAFDGTSWYPTARTTSRSQIRRTASGVIAENGDVFAFGAPTAPTSQTIYGSLIGLSAGDVITGVELRNHVAAAGTLPTTVRFGLADSTGKILVLSGNLNALASWGQGPLQFAFTAPYTVLADGGYYAVFVVNGTWGTTQPTPRAVNPTQWTTNAVPGKLALAGQQTGQTDLPAVGSSVALVVTSLVFYMGVY